MELCEVNNIINFYTGFSMQHTIICNKWLQNDLDIVHSK